MSETSQTMFESGAIRSGKSALETNGAKFPARFELISPIGLRRVAEAYGEGASKYPLGNWQKGIPESSLVQHALSHIFAYMDGDTQEDHIGHAIWNLMTLCHFQEKRPDLMDLQPIREGNARTTEFLPLTEDKLTATLRNAKPRALQLWNDIQGEGVKFPDPGEFLLWIMDQFEALRKGGLSDPLLRATVGPLEAENQRLRQKIADAESC